jgi:CubicO group peptidase (beta-lactamase class C family)
MRVLLRLAAALAVLASTAKADTAKPVQSLGELDAKLAQAFKDAGIPGGEVAIVEHGQVVFVKAYGLADVRNKIPATPESVFRAGSISKSITSIAVMSLVEQKKLSLDDKLASRAPEVTFVNPWEASDPVRVVNLLEHTTGWPDISTRVLAEDGPGWSVGKGVAFTMPEFVSRWKPGHFAVYNNAGPAVAGLIVEKVSGQSFNDYVDAHVLRPMGMASADFELTPALGPHIAKSYATDGSETPFQNIILPPAGSLNTTARELAQLVRFFLGRGTVDGKQILNPASVERIERSESNLASKDGFVEDYGLGNAPFTGSGIIFRGHNGQIDSFTAVYGYLMRCNCGYVLMANGGRSDGANFGTPMAALVEGYLTRGLTMTPPPAVAVPGTELEKYAGIYRVVTPPNNLVKPFVDLLGFSRVSAAHGKITIVSLIGGADYVPVAPHVFRRTDREQPSVAFEEEDGRVYKIAFLNAAEKQPLWLAGLVALIAAVLVLGTAGGIIGLVVWAVASFRGRLHARGGWMVRIAPLLSVLALLVTAALVVRVIAGSNTSAFTQLATVGPYSLTIFATSLLYPLFALWGLWLTYRRIDASLAVRLYAGAMSAAMLALSAYMLPIGWIGLRSWTM